MSISDRRSERGTTLVEAILAAMILLIVVVGAMQFLLVRAAGVEMEERARRANDAGDAALEGLTANLNKMGFAATLGGGSFAVGTDNRVTLGTCSFTWCDKYVVDADGSLIANTGPVATFGVSFAGGTAWSAAVPTGGRAEFVRRWRIDKIAGQPDLRQITVAVFSSQTSTEPLFMQTTRVANRTVLNP